MTDHLPRWAAMGAQERAEAYSPSTMVGGDIGTFIEAYVQLSADAYASVPDVQTKAYGPAARQTYDLAVPNGPGPHPVHVFIHGGYWQELSKKESFFAAPGFLEQGVAFAAVNYTLAPHARVAEIVDEICCALTHLREHADASGLDPARITVSGSSAGAHLAAMATLNLPLDQRPAALVLLSGIYDLRPLVGTYINDALRMDQAEVMAVSPALRDLAGFPPTLIAWGEHETDEFKRQSRQFAQLLGEADGDVRQLEVAGRNHFDIVHNLTVAGL